MNTVNDAKTENQQHGMLDQMACGGTTTYDIDQVAARTINRQKREKRQ